MAVFSWPTSLKPTDFGYYLVNADTSGGAAMDGSEQFVVSAGPRLGASMTLPIFNKQTVLAVRALQVNLMGRGNAVDLPNFDGLRVSWPELYANGEPTGLTLTPGVTRNKALDGTSFADPLVPDASQIVATLATGAPARATSALIAVTQGGVIRAGQQFSLGVRLHMIGTTSPGIASPGQVLTSVTFQPPLRSAAAAGAAVRFTNARARMRCLNLNDELRKLELLRFATLNLEFSEYI